MLETIKNILYSITKTRIHVALIFFFLMATLPSVFMQTDIQLHLSVPIAYSIWIFALYLFDRVHDTHKDMDTDAKDTFSLSTSRLLLIFSIGLAFVPVVLLWWSGQRIWPALVLFPITFLYTVPIYKGVRAKDIFIFKNLYSALFIFTLPMFFVIYVYAQYTWDLERLLMNLGYLTMFVFVGEVIWDIKDIDADKKHGVRTFPALYGLEKTRIFVLALLIGICLYSSYFSRGVNIPMMLGFVTFVLLVRKNTPVWIYHLPLLVILFFQCKNYFGWW